MQKSEQKRKSFSKSMDGYVSLADLPNRKEMNKNVEMLSCVDGKFQIFEKIILKFESAEKHLLSLLKEQKEISFLLINKLLKAFYEYNEVVASLKRFDDDVFIVSVLKKTNSLYKPVFSDCVLSMKERVKEKLADNGTYEKLQQHYDWQGDFVDPEDEESFEWLVQNQKPFFILEGDNAPSFYDLSYEDTVYHRVYDKSGQFYMPIYSNEMYQAFFDIIKEKTADLKKNKKFNWDNVKSNEFKFDEFFENIFSSALKLRRSFLKDDKYVSDFKEERLLKKEVLSATQKLLQEFTKDEKKELGRLWDRFSLSVDMNQLEQIDFNWTMIKRSYSLSSTQESAYTCYIERMLYNEIFVPFLAKKNIPVDLAEFLNVMQKVLYLEKRSLKKFLKWILKNSFLELLPFLSLSLIKTGIYQMQKKLNFELEELQKNLLILHIATVKKSTNLGLKADKIQPTVTKGNINRFDEKGRTVLFKAVADEDVDFVKELIFLNIDVMQADFKGQTALMMAAQKGNKEIFDLILSKTSDVFLTDEKKKTLLHFAIHGKNLDVLQKVLTLGINVNQPDNLGNTALHEAVQKDNAAGFRLLLENGADPYLTNNKGRSVIRLIKKKDKQFQTAFFDYEKNKKVYECLLFQGILTLNNDFILKAIENKVHLKEVYLYQRTPLEWALLLDDKEIISLLLRKKSFCDKKISKDVWFAPLKHAIMLRDEQYFDLLIKSGADITGIDPETKQSLLHFAVMSGCLEIVQELIQKGLDIHLKDWQGQTPVDFSHRLDFFYIEKFFMDLGK